MDQQEPVQEPRVDTVPPGLGSGGAALWRSIGEDFPGVTLTGVQRVQLLEACRAKDQLDRMDQLLRGEADVWCTLVQDFNSETSYNLRVTSLVQRANDLRNVMKQLLAALRLPDPASGKVPQYRGPRGAQAPSVPGGKPKEPTALDRLRERRAGVAGA